jgi:bacillithiol biosynthesis cysteine-adding enzyme BshC
LPDNALLKNEFSPLIRKELKEQFSHRAVAQTVEVFPAEYKVQASGREINLFYLKDDVRERIEYMNGEYQVLHTDIRFDEAGMSEEISRHPERFSPNVILRPLFQELILPNILFIGGGGELAYWLELKKVFQSAAIPFPMLVLRNSFMVVDQKRASKIQSLQMDVVDFFNPTHEVVLKLVRQSSMLKLELAEEKKSLEKQYQQIKSVAAAVDATLQIHTDALFKKANKKLEQLERKMLLSEKKKFDAQQRQIEQVKSILFPSGGLQERVDNIIPYYASYGSLFLDMLYEHSLGLQHQFTIITEMA